MYNLETDNTRWRQEKTKEAITNVQSRDTDNTGWRQTKVQKNKHNTENWKGEQYETHPKDSPNVTHSVYWHYKTLRHNHSVQDVVKHKSGRHCCDRMIVGFTTTYIYAIIAYHYWCCEFESSWWRGSLDTT